MNKKKLSFISIVLLTINAIIGTGIFLSPGSVTTLAGDKAPLIYLVAAILAIVLAITFASAAKYVKKSGAAYAYAKGAFGDQVGFYVGVTRFVAGSIAWGVMATGAVKTVLSIYGLDSSDFKLITIGFIILMLVLLLINVLGIRFVEIINNISTLGKLAALLVFIIAGGFIVITTGENHYSDVMSLQVSGQPLVPSMNLTVFITATLAAFYAFTGFESVATGSQDMENPEKNLPRALPIGILIIALIYMGIVYIAMLLNSKTLVETKEVVVLASLFNQPVIRNIILYGAFVSMFGINVAASFSTPRILEALAKEKQLPSIFAYRTKLDAPLIAMITTVLFAVVIPLSFNYNMANIMILSSLSRFIQFLVVPISVIIFYYGRQKESILENVEKNYITDVIIPLIAFLFSLFLVVKFDWKAQFSITLDNGNVVANTAAIIAVIISYIILPIGLLIWKNTRKN